MTSTILYQRNCTPNENYLISLSNKYRAMLDCFLEIKNDKINGNKHMGSYLLRSKYFSLVITLVVKVK